jgi:hypothetical protein
MKDVDRMIRDALRDEDAAEYDQVAGELTWLDNALGLFRGRSRWLAINSAIAMAILLAVTIWMVFRFFEAPSTRGMLAWGGGILMCVVGGIAMKIFAWIEMSKQMLMREIKRLELQVAYLAMRDDHTDATVNPQ